MSERSAICFFVWGESYVRETEQCILNSKPIHKYDLILLTDLKTNVSTIEKWFKTIIRVPFETSGLIRKTELFRHLPEEYDLFLMLDSDTVVLEDISLGFEKASEYGIAVAQAYPYTLESFFNFSEVMNRENVPKRGQLQYNSGVIFFKNTAAVKAVMEHWKALAMKYRKLVQNDQPYLSLAMEMLHFNPYTLPITYNYRGSGEHISGSIKIWHSHHPMPQNINKNPNAWPPRRAYPLSVQRYDVNKFISWPVRFIKKWLGKN